MEYRYDLPESPGNSQIGPLPLDRAVRYGFK